MLVKISRTNLKFALAALVGLTAFAASATAQEIGGSSAGVFRPGNPKPTANNSSSKTAAKSGKTKAKTSSAAAKNRQSATASNKNTVAKKTVVRQPRTTPKVKPSKRLNTDELLEAAIAEGNEARDALNFIAAQDAYERAQELNPKDARAFYGLGNVYTDQQRWDEAEEQYRQSLKINPNQVEANIALSYVLLQPNRGGNMADRFEEAEVAARRAIQIEPTNPMAHDQLGVSLELRGLIGAETENAYRRAIELDKNFALAYAHLGRLLRKKGKSGDSAEKYKQAIALANDIPTVILVTEVLQSENRFEESEKLLRQAQKVDANNPVILFLLGRALSMRNNFSEAETVLTNSIRISPRTFGAYSTLGAIYLRQEKYDDAERIYKQALPFASEAERQQLAGAFGFLGVGDGFMKRGRKTDALRVYRQALELDADNAQLTTKIAALKGNNR